MPIEINSTSKPQEDNNKTGKTPQATTPAETGKDDDVLSQHSGQMSLGPTQQEPADEPDSQSIDSPESTAGLTQDELRDPNAISVTVSDHSTPVVVLYGPPSCGKTMTLVRMARYLASQGYTVVPEKTFRPSSDKNYKQLCDNFGEMINSNSAAASTNNISFMLVKVLMEGKPICQFLEAPGEHYFLPDDPNRPYPAYMNAIFNSDNKKIWAIMIEPDWSDYEPRANYSARIRQLKSHHLSSKDKVVFVYNKIDLTAFFKDADKVKIKEAIKNVGNLYPNIFVPFKNENPITKFFKEYNCEFVPFMTGNYNKTEKGVKYTEGRSIYAKKLWQVILKLLKN